MEPKQYIRSIIICFLIICDIDKLKKIINPTNKFPDYSQISQN